MQITNSFNRLYHGAFLKYLYDQMVQRKCIIMRFVTFKDAIKHINPDYPRDNKGDPISTKDISSKALVQHIDFIIAWSGSYGVTPRIIDEEWERTLNDFR